MSSRRARIVQYLVGHPLLRRESDPAGPWQVIGWWEVRRVPYNLLVGAIGVVSGMLAMTAAMASERLGGEPLGAPDGLGVVLAPIVFAVLANACYTGGWVMELLLRALWRAESRVFAPLALALGVAFSAVVTLVPAWAAILYLLYLVTAGGRAASGT